MHITGRLHKSIEFRVPLEKFAPSASCHFNQIKRFGCIGFVKIPKPDFKFGERAIKAVLVGYKTTGFLLWHPSTRKFIESRHVRFNEKVVYKDVYESDQFGQNSQELKEENDCNWLLRPGIIYLIFPNGIRNGNINFCSEFLDERVLVRDVEHTSGIGEIIIFL